MATMTPSGRRSLISAIAMTVLAYVAVVLRILAKKKTKARWGLDDTMIFLALIGMSAWLGLETWGTEQLPGL